eukprot:c25779_g1_i1.p1 GENE.c25779_g1_i1~~c25779_g1_i1.p1  ORF type:complete len:945 (+),score=246.80 c25779_g1_i1:44-2878(+)
MTRVSLLGLSVLVSVSIATADPLIKYLHEFQSASGGFHEPASEVPDLEATSHALFLASLYGLKSQINADDAAQFVQGLGNGNDFGYGLSAGAPSDLASTRYALASYIHLGKAIPDSQKVSDFIRSLSDVRTGLFAARAGEGGDYRSTALAIEALDLTNELQKPVAQELLKRIKDSLSEKVVATETQIHFNLNPQSQTPISDNYYAIYLASKSGFKFNDVEKWAAFITAQQDLDRQSPTFGGFFANVERTVVTAEATAHAALSLHLLDHEAGVEYALYQYTQSRKSTIKETALSHLAFAHARVFKRAFSTDISYDSDGTAEIDQQIMEGLRIVPKAFVSIFEGKVVHGGFSVVVKEAGGWQSAMKYDHDRRVYVAEQDFDTTGKLGAVSFSFEFSSTVFPIGDINLSTTDKKSIGYLMQVQSQATFAGRSINAGESAPAGTEFTFDVSFSTRSKPSFISGAFYVDFEVVDSSEVVHYKIGLEGKSNTKPIVFSYTLTGDDFTSGPVNFLVTVRNEAGPHSYHSVSYALDQQMVASSISFAGLSASAPKNFRFGDSIKVTIQPASLKDLHTIVPYSAANAAKRTFILDLSTADGTTFLSVSGTPVGSQVEFEGTIPASLDATGTSVVSFRFVAVSGSSVTLHPYDSQSNELFEDASSIQVTVDSDLHVGKFEKKPTTSSFTYGTEIPFEFVITDSVSGKDVSAGKLGEVAIVLTSGHGATAFEAGRVVAQSAGADKPFSAVLEIDANTVKGDGEITIKAFVGEREIPLFVEGKKESVRFPASVGGEITLTKTVFTTSSAAATKTAFLASFSLSCEGKPLKGAHLRATVLSSGPSAGVVERYSQPLKNLLVSFDSEGKYSFSFTTPHANIKSGTYKVEFQRESDLARARQASATETAPLFTIDVPHKAINVESHWMQMEIAALMVLTALYFGVSGNARFFKTSKKLA